jgi:hypothetical protein
VLSQAQSHADFFIAQTGVIRWEVAGKIAFIMAGPPEDRALEQPFTGQILPAAAQAANPLQQGRNMRGIAEPASQRRAGQCLNYFHGQNITWLG